MATKESIKHELMMRISPFKLKGYAIFLYGSLARDIKGMKGYRIGLNSFRKNSDIDILIVPSLGKTVLSSSKQRKIERQLGGFIDSHKIHVFSHPSALEYKERILLKRM